MQRLVKYLPTIIVFALVLLVAGYRYQQYVIERNFVIHVNAPCDGRQAKCFVSDCSPEDDLSCPAGPYKKVDVLSSIAPACLQEHTCEQFVCAGLAGCEETFCSEDIVDAGETCSLVGE